MVCEICRNSMQMDGINPIEFDGIKPNEFVTFDS